ncbi:MAG: ATP-binding cassette domain-containing protein, partial [Sutterella sp.]|nr:ATP-binding cassette domain-containing protein [Sutterella sp.]
MSISLELRGICREYVKDNESFLAVDNVNLTVNPGEFLTFLGPSGCGKTTT